MESTQQLARPRFEASDIDPRDPLGLGLVEPVLPTVPNPVRPERNVQQPQATQQQAQQPPVRQEPMALPSGPSEGGAPAEQGWYREEGRPGEQAYQPRRPGTTAPGFPPQEGQRQAPQGRPQRPQRPQGPQQQAPQQRQPQQQAQAPQQQRAPQAPQPQAPQAQAPHSRPEQQAPQQQAQQQAPGQQQPDEAPWRPSANDERWRRAEQVREPSTSGVTMSGLPGAPRRPTWSPEPPSPPR